jgi:hypothetical protein
MNCAGFEDDLARLLAGEEAGEERRARLVALRAHAQACPDCGDASDLLELLALPRGERDLAEPPSDRYWDSFEAALTRRLARGGPSPRRDWGAWSGVAAALLLAAVGLWFVLSPGHTWMPGEELAAEEWNGNEIPDSLELLLRAAEPDDALAGLDFLGGLAGLAEAPSEAAGPDSGGFFYPDPGVMDAEARRALLDWLRERESRERGVES